MKNTQTKASPKSVDIPALLDKMRSLGVTLQDVRRATVARKTKKGISGYSYHKIRRTLTLRDQIQPSIVKVALDLVAEAESKREEMLKKAEELQLTEA